MKKIRVILVSILLAAAALTRAANPIFQAADPHAVFVDGTCYIYPTGSRGQFYVYTSPDLLTWQRHDAVLNFRDIDWIPRGKSPWAPAVVERDGRWYFYYSAGAKPSSIGVARGDSPLGPFTDSGKALLSDDGKPGFEAIDPMVFCDPNGPCYLYAGGSAGSTLRVFELADDMVSFTREIEVETPKEFTEGVFLHIRNGIYYLSYSHGRWRDASYSVHYATAKSPTGPWEYKGPILTSNDTYKGPGHHSFVHNPVNDQWYIVYHRWENVSGDGPYRGSRSAAIDIVEYNPDGTIKPVTMTAKGPAAPLH